MTDRIRDLFGVHSERKGCRRGVAVREVSRSTLQRLIDGPESIFRIRASAMVKNDVQTCLVRATIPTRNGDLPVAGKRVRRLGIRKILSSLLIGNRALKSWNLAVSLTARGIATARPVAAVFSGRRHPAHETFLFHEWLEGAEQVDQFIETSRVWSGRERLHLEIAAAESLGRAIGRLHSEGFSHRDLKVSNLMLRKHADGVEAFIIDLDGAASPLWLMSRRRYRDLARLCICFPDDTEVRRSVMWRFLESYRTHGPDKDITVRQLWKRVDLSARRLRRRKRRPHPVSVDDRSSVADAVDPD